MNHYETAAMMALGAALGAMVHSGKTDEEILALVRNAIDSTRDQDIAAKAREFGEFVLDRTTA